MRLEYRTTWFRILVELLERPTPIRRYRVVPAGLETATHRLLRRRIARSVRGSRAAEMP